MNHDPTFPLTLRFDQGPNNRGALTLTAEALGVVGGRPRWRVTLRAGEQGYVGSCSLHLPIDEREVVPWFLFPGFFYGQGRTDPSLQYPALGERDDAATRPLAAVSGATSANAGIGWTHPSWDFALDRGAFPVLLAHTRGRWLGIDWSPHYHTHPHNEHVWGDSEPQIGAGLAWSRGVGGGELRINLPANERPRRHARNRYDHATARALDLAPHQSITFSVGVWDFCADRHGYQDVLETLYRELAPTHPPAAPEPNDLLARVASHGLLAWHWVDPPGYMTHTQPFDRVGESIANAKGVTLARHLEAIGFVAGFPVVFALLWHATRTGDQPSRAAAEKMLERFCEHALTPWGFFRTSFHPGKARTPNGVFPNPAPRGAANPDPTGDTPFYGSCWVDDQRLVHARTTADASNYLARAIALLPADHPRRAHHRAALRRSLDAALAAQDAQGRFGQLYNVIDKTVHQNEGAGGLLWITALHHAEPLFPDDPWFQARLRDAMVAAGEGYAPDVEAEYICGAPEDVSLAPTSEDGYNAIMGYAALHHRFGKPRDLTLLRKAADWTLSFRKAYNVRFHPKSILHPYRTTGGDFASCNNNHLHVYGMCCLADLHYLSQQTRSEYYARRADDHFAFSSQHLVTTPGQWGGQLGMCDEQFYTTDWGTYGDWDPTPNHTQKGTLCGFSHAWCITMILLGLEQLERAATK